MRKRLMSLVLCLAMILGMGVLPPGILAAEEDAAHYLLRPKDFLQKGTWSIQTHDVAFEQTTLIGKQDKDPSQTEAATASFSVTAAGTYRIWVHGKRNQGGSSQSSTAWTFQVAVDDETLEKTFGGKASFSGFEWSDGGTVELTAQDHTISLLDTSADWARCDAVLITSDLTLVPSNNYDDLLAQLAGEALGPVDDGVANIVDNREEAASSEGSWTLKTTNPSDKDPAYGPDYAISNGEADSTFTWQLEIPKAATYELFWYGANFYNNTSLADHACYQLLQNGEVVASYSTTQQLSAGWHPLGEVKLEAGTAQLTLSQEEGSKGNLMADAIKFSEAIIADETNFVVDNAAEGTVKGGAEANWQEFSGGMEGSYSACTGENSDSTYFTWPVAVPQAGYWTAEVYIPENTELELAESVSYEVVHGGRTETVPLVPRELVSNEWTKLGTWNFTGEEGEMVSLYPEKGAAGWALVDAVRLTYRGATNPDALAVIVDNTEEDLTILTGTWRDTTVSGTTGWQGTSTYRSGFVGENYFSLRAGDPEATFTWKFAAPETGYYRAYVNIADGTSGSLAQSVTYQLTGSDGKSKTSALNHAQPAGYYSLGTVYLEKGDAAVPVIKLVSLDNNSCMVDAAMIEYLGTELPVEKGYYRIDLDDPQQTIWGLGVEIQSDSLDSGNTMNDTPYSVPHDLVEEERQRMYTDLLSGFRYMRLAGGLFYRGTDDEKKHLVPRWPEQDAELAELLEVSGIEGFNFEFWSPTPYFKSSGAYHGGKLKCFDKSWEYYGDEEKTREFLEDFADTLVYDFQRMRDAGLPIVQFSLQNEPPLTSVYGTYSFCTYGEQDYYDACKIILPRLKEAFPDLFIHAPSWDGQHAGSSKMIKEDPELLQYVDGWSWHSVGWNADQMLNNREYYNSGTADKPVFNTEFEYQPWNFGGQYDFRFVNTAQAIMNWMTFENSPTWYWLHALKPLGNEESLGYSLGVWRKTNDDSVYDNHNEVEKGHWDYNYPNYNAIRGFLEFMPWDSVRYTVHEDEIRTNQRIMAWKSPEGRLAFALTNRDGSEPFQYIVDTSLDDVVFQGYQLTSSCEEIISLGTKTGAELQTTLDPYTIQFWVQEADDTMIMANGVKISNSNLTLGVNGTAQLTAEVQPDNAANKNVRWTSSDSTIVKVDENGNITALKEGTATVTATAISGSGRYSADCVVTVDTSIPVDKYTVTVNNSYAETSGAGMYQPGQQVTVQAGSRSGYRFDGWTVEGITVSDSSSETVTFTMPSGNVTFTANWSSIGGGSSSSSGDYSISMNTGSNGKISVSPSRADKGDTVTITVKPDSGYVLDTLTVTDKNGDSVKLTEKDENRYTFTMPASKVTVKATFTAETQESDLPFTDVSAEDYFYDAVRWAVENNITTGTSAAAFSPSAACTRGQMVTFLWRAAGCPAPKSTSNPFTDVEESDYCYEAVLWAVENGITAGTSATTFSPDAVVTRGQTVTFLYRYDGASAAADADFTDVSEDAYYYDAVQWAAESGITTGTTATTFSPDAACTRGQIVTFLFRDLAE